MRRGRIEIIMEVLEIAKTGVSKTNIVYKANLNLKLADKYLDLLQKDGMLENRLDKYIITEKGKMFLKKAQDMGLSYSSLI